SKIRDGVLNMLTTNMGLKAGEQVLVVSDVPRDSDWREKEGKFLGDVVQRTLLSKAVSEIATEAFPESLVEFTIYPMVSQHGDEPPAWLGQRMARAQVVIAITTFSLSHTQARELATQASARIASMPGFLMEMFYPDGPMTVDYIAISGETARIATALTEAEQVHITCPAGTDLTFSLKGRYGHRDDGLYRKPGQWGNLPAGEAYTTPLEGTAQGRLVVSPGWHANLTETLVINFEDGEAVSLEGGGAVREELERVLRFGDPDTAPRRNCAELGIGTNPNARRTDNTLEAEKIRGTLHIALGDNAHMGGIVAADYHQDFVISHPTLTLDGKAIMEDGELML
ncbi:MAG TPA: hypothetical protein EYH31_00520, partial [Anaerolineae bacterium]|nr:hypothetical protein [Anaerolineae bacterium]